MTTKSFLSRLRQMLVNDHRRTSYGQCGEDLILDHLFSLLQIRQPTYLDVGAHHPSYLSNTYYFYRRGCYGVCIEPNPELHAVIQRKRPRDTCLNVGIGFGDARMSRFYVFYESVLSTFSESVAQEQIIQGRTIKRELDIVMKPLDEIIEKHLRPHPNLVSLDTEGLDLAILQSVNFTKHRPEVFCVETLTNVDERKIDAIFEFMAEKNYFVFADTYINTIFVEGTAWKARCSRLGLTDPPKTHHSQRD